MGDEYYKPGTAMEFIKFMDYLDSKRNTKWRQVLHDVAALLDECVEYENSNIRS
jgi:hypothetical protein